MLPLKKDTRLVRALHQKKFRIEHGLFIVEGKKMVAEALASGFPLHSLYTTDEEFAGHEKRAVRLTTREMEAISALNTSSPYLAVLFQDRKNSTVLEGEPVVVLDGISDPGNMGTIIRTADWFGTRMIFCTPDCVELYNPKVVQSTMGSIFRVVVRELPVGEIILLLKEKGYHLLGADMKGENLFGFSFPPKTALVVGSESHGLRNEFVKALDKRIHIPGKGDAESLNASVAAGIIMGEWFRGSH